MTRTPPPYEINPPQYLLARAERAHQQAKRSLRDTIVGVKREMAERTEWTTQARLDVATAVRYGGLHDPATARAIRHANAVEDATEWCAEDGERHISYARNSVAEAARRLTEAREAANR